MIQVASKEVLFAEDPILAGKMAAVYIRGVYKCDNRKSQLEKKYKNMTVGYESLLFLLAWYSISTTLFTAILSPVFFNTVLPFSVR